MKLTIVGGGVTGCMLALALLKKDYKIQILESSNNIGGILEDYKYEDKIFLRNCQYIDENSLSSELIKKTNYQYLNKYRHIYGSWNDLFKNKQISYDFAELQVPGKVLTPKNKKKIVNLRDKLSVYDDLISAKLVKWHQKFLNIDELSHCNSIQFINRIYPIDIHKTILKQKKEDIFYDKHYGVPSNLKTKNFFFPKRGFNHLFKHIQKYLEDNGVDIKLNSPIKAKVKANKFSIYVRGNEVITEKVIWTANPSSLFPIFLNKKLDSIPIKIINFVADIDGDVPDNPIYYQIYSIDIPILRIYFYFIGNPKVTIELIDIKLSDQEIMSYIYSILSDIGIKITIKNYKIYPETRYSLVSINDKCLMDELNNIIPKYNTLVTGGWHLYSRDEKIQFSLDQLGIK